MNPGAQAPNDLERKAAMLGYHSLVILAGRRSNGGMGKLIAEQAITPLVAYGSYVMRGGFIDDKATFDGPALQAAGYRLWRL